MLGSSRRCSRRLSGWAAPGSCSSSFDSFGPRERFLSSLLVWLVLVWRSGEGKGGTLRGAGGDYSMIFSEPFTKPFVLCSILEPQNGNGEPSEARRS